MSVGRRMRTIRGGKHEHHFHVVRYSRRCTYTIENDVHDDCQIK